MTTETAWLIEMKDTASGIRYLTLRPEVPGFWTEDANLAIRFCRKQDAEDYLGFWDDDGVSHAVEHMWCDVPSSGQFGERLHKLLSDAADRINAAR